MKNFGVTDLLSAVPSKNVFAYKPTHYTHEFYLSGEILSSENYSEWFDVIRNASLNDTVKIYINSPGGDLFTAVQFKRVLDECNGKVIASVEGMCMSAATMIFLSAHEFEVSEYSQFMFHNYSSGLFGKGGEMFDRVSHERVWSKRMWSEIYADFLTGDEIKSLMEGKDIWMEGEDVACRLESKFDLKTKAENDLSEFWDGDDDQEDMFNKIDKGDNDE